MKETWEREMRVKAAAALWPFVQRWRESETESWDGIDAALAAAPLASWLRRKEEGRRVNDAGELNMEEQCGGWRDAGAHLAHVFAPVAWLDGRRGVGPISMRYRERRGARGGGHMAEH